MWESQWTKKESLAGSLQNCDWTYHPLEAGEAAHLCGGVNWSHSILGANAQRTARIGDQIFEDVQVTLLSCQVNWRYVVLHLHVSTVTDIKENIWVVKQYGIEYKVVKTTVGKRPWKGRKQNGATTKGGRRRSLSQHMILLHSWIEILVDTGGRKEAYATTFCVEWERKTGSFSQVVGDERPIRLFPVHSRPATFIVPFVYYARIKRLQVSMPLTDKKKRP